LGGTTGYAINPARTLGPELYTLTPKETVTGAMLGFYCRAHHRVKPALFYLPLTKKPYLKKSKMKK
jgi:hypothetical protein